MIVHSTTPSNFSWRPSDPVSDRDIVEHMKARGCKGVVTVARSSDERYEIDLSSGKTQGRRRWLQIGWLESVKGRRRVLNDWCVEKPDRFVIVKEDDEGFLITPLQYRADAVGAVNLHEYERVSARLSNTLAHQAATPRRASYPRQQP